MSSGTLFLYLASSFKKQGVKVIDLGQVSTPFCFWYSQKYRLDALMITGSHNAANQNGLKVYTPRLGPVDKKSGLLKIQKKFEGLDYKPEPIDLKEAKFVKHNAVAEYRKFMLSLAKKISPKIKLAIDFSNGDTANEVIPVLEKLKVNFVTLNEKVDGRFPGHTPNPLDESSQKDLRFLMQHKKFNLGAIIDGDGDRILFFDEKGERIDPNYIGCLLIKYYLHGQKNGGVVRTVSLSRIMDETARASGVKLFVSKVGRSHVRRLVHTKKADLGVEKSGHYFFKEYYNGDSSLLCLLKILQIISRAGRPVSELIKPYLSYVILPETNIPFDGKVDNILNTLREKFADGQLSELDGLRVDYPDWAFNVRKSNTENLWRLMVEGTNKEKVEQYKKEIEEVLNS